MQPSEPPESHPPIRDDGTRRVGHFGRLLAVCQGDPPVHFASLSFFSWSGLTRTPGRPRLEKWAFVVCRTVFFAYFLSLLGMAKGAKCHFDCAEWWPSKGIPISLLLFSLRGLRRVCCEPAHPHPHPRPLQNPHLQSTSHTHPHPCELQLGPRPSIHATPCPHVPHAISRSSLVLSAGRRAWSIFRRMETHARVPPSSSCMKLL